MAAGRVESEIEAQRAEELRNAGVRLVTGTLDDPEHLRTMMTGRECVIHLAAAQHESHMSDDYFRQINVEGTRAFLTAAS